MIAFYGRTLRFVLDHQPVTLIVAVITLAVTVLLYVVIPKGFFPLQDTGVILGISEAPQSVSFAAMAKRQQQLAEVVLANPAVESLSSFIGIDGINSTLNSGRILINLKPLEQRAGSAAEIIRELQPKLAEVQGINLYMQPVQDLSIEDRVSRTQYQYTLEDADANELGIWSEKLIQRLQTEPVLRDVTSDHQNEGLRANLTIDRLTASRLGVTPQLFDDTLYDAFGQRQVSTMFTQLNQYRVILEVKPEFQKGPGALKDIYVHPGGGSQVPLSAFTTFDEGTGPLAINHQGQFPAITMSFNLAPAHLWAMR
jgi:multidrug efflux pump